MQCEPRIFRANGTPGTYEMVSHHPVLSYCYAVPCLYDVELVPLLAFQNDVVPCLGCYTAESATECKTLLGAQWRQERDLRHNSALFSMQVAIRSACCSTFQ